MNKATEKKIIDKFNEFMTVAKAEQDALIPYVKARNDRLIYSHLYVVIRGIYRWYVVQSWLSSVTVCSDVVYPTFYANELCYHGWYSSSFTKNHRKGSPML